MTEIDIESLVGEHVLSGASMDSASNGGVIVRFTLSGKHYEAMEEQDDGYRSSLGSLTEGEIPPLKKLGPLKVHVALNGGVLEFKNAQTGAVVLAIGTDGSDYYYPSFTGYICPENAR